MAETTRKKIAVLDDFQGVALRYADWSLLADRADVTVFRDHLHDPDAVVARLAPFDVVCVMRERTPLSAEMIARLPNLKLIVTTAMWNASLDSACAVARGITVCGTNSIQSGTPELIWLLILALARRLPEEQASMRNGGWQTNVGMDLRRRTLGVVGLGQIGTRITKVANAFGMQVIAWSQNLAPERASEAGATRVDKETLFRDADFVTVNLKLSERTRHIVGVAEFALMKRSAFFINTSRGPLVDEAALVDALHSGRIAGAGIDVYNMEPPPPDHPFRTLPNVIATPHIGYVTDATYAMFYPQIVEDIDAWLKGAPIRLLTAQSMTPS
jgi:phosphoglycerate dehydrogenase-like enzyme